MMSLTFLQKNVKSHLSKHLVCPKSTHSSQKLRPTRSLKSRGIVKLQSKVSIPKRFYVSPFEDRLKMKLVPMKQKNKFANNERGDLSEYNHTIHGLSATTGGKDLEVLKAWERGDYIGVIDICNDSIEDFESQGIDWSDKFAPAVLKSPNPPKNISLQDIKPSSPVTLHETESQSKVSLCLLMRNLKAAALNQLQRYKEAIKTADETLVKTNYKDRDAWCLKGTALNAIGIKTKDEAADKEAISCFEKALALLHHGDVDIEAGLNHATILFRIGRIPEAIKEIHILLSHTTAYQASLTDPANDFEEPVDMSTTQAQIQLDKEHIKYDPDMRLLLAAMYLKTKQFEQAIEQCQLGIAAVKRKGAISGPLPARFYEIQLSASIPLKRFAEAELIATMLLKLSPGNYEVFEIFFLAITSLKKPHDYVMKAFEQFQKEVQIHPGKTVRILQLKTLYLQSKELHHELIEVCDQILKFGPNRLTMLAKAKALLQIGQFKLADAVCNQALSEPDPSKEFILCKAVCQDKLERWEEALKYYHLAVNADPEWSQAHYQLGAALARIGKNDSALASFDTSIRLNPKNTAPLIAKANLLRGTGRLREATETYAKIAKLNPETKEEYKEILQRFQKARPDQFMDPQKLKELQEKREAFEESFQIPQTSSISATDFIKKDL